MDRKVFLKNTAILTGASLALRGIGMAFRVYLAAQIGAQGMGLYQLITTVYNLALTVATAGMGVAATRLITEELALSGGGRLRSLCGKLVAAALGMGLLAAAIQFLGADFAAKVWLGDERAMPALRILAFSLPVVAVGSCLQGYFMARRTVTLATGAQVAEQLLRIALVMILLPAALQKGLGEACGAVVLGGTAAELVSGAVIWVGYRRDLARMEGGQRPSPAKGVARRLWSIAAPVAATRYVGSGLRTLENVMVPGCLAVFTGSRAVALEQFGALKGMAMAVLFFPFSFLATLSTLLMPEITEAYARGRQRVLEGLISRTILITLTVSVLMGGMFTLFSGQLGELLFHDSQVGFYIRVLGPVMPFMYLESMVDGVLKGLNQQLSTFRYSVWDSVVRIALIAFLVPRQGMQGFLFVMLVSNLFTGFLNLHRLLTVTGLSFQWGQWVIKPVLAFLSGMVAYEAVYRPFAAARGLGESLLADLFLGGALVGVVYLLFLFLSGGLPELRRRTQ
jgi:stage V sporulation protein B